jgi:hypothetical protein
MPINGVDSMSLAKQYISGQISSADSSNTFKNVLTSEVLGLQSGDASKAGSYTTQYDMLSSMLMDSSDMNAMLLAAMISFGAGSSPNGIYSMLSKLSGTSQSIEPISYTKGITSVENTNGIIPYEAWKPSYPSITSDINNRSAVLYTDVINQFQVETNGRYAVNKNGHIGTYCNIFMWDVTRAMGAEIPHYYDASTGEPMKYGDDDANEMTANRIYDWLQKYGEDYGWFEVTAPEAQELANQGRPVVTALRNMDGGHGHTKSERYR